MTATVDIRNVSHRFGDTQALENITLTINAGQYAVLLGPSGCGKTTLLSVLGGFVSPDEGRVLLNNEDVTDVRPAQRATTTMFQDYALFPHMTLRDNVGFGLRMRGISRAQRHNKARELLSLVGLDDSSHKKPHELSGGQRQRVALARALAVEPDVLLLDEPLGALDLKLRRQMQDELKAIQKRVGTTFVHVTHDQEEAMAIADDVIVMNAGHIEDTGSPESIYLKPKTIFSATFMGEANLISGTVQSCDFQSIVVSTAQGVFDLDHTHIGNQNVDPGTTVMLAIRPEHIATGERPKNEWADLGPFDVVDIAFFGSYQRCQLRARNGQTLIAHFPQDSAVHTGQNFTLRVNRASIVLLGPESSTG